MTHRPTDPSKINLPGHVGHRHSSPAEQMPGTVRDPSPLETPPPPTLPAASPEIQRVSKDGHHVDRRLLTLARLKHAQKKSSNGMMCRVGGGRGAPLDPGDCPPRHPHGRCPRHGAGQSPSAGRSSAQAGGGRREEAALRRRRAGDSNPAPLCSWLRTGLDGDRNSLKTASFKQLQAFLPASNAPGRALFPGSGKEGGRRNTPEQEEWERRCQRHM